MITTNYTKPKRAYPATCPQCKGKGLLDRVQYNVISEQGPKFGEVEMNHVQTICPYCAGYGVLKDEGTDKKVGKQ